MSTRTLELSEEVYNLLQQAADARNTTPGDLIATLLPKPLSRPQATPEAIAEANARMRASMVSLGYATGTDNETIDSDLAREYSNSSRTDDYFALLIRRDVFSRKHGFWLSISPKHQQAQGLLTGPTSSYLHMKVPNNSAFARRSVKTDRHALK